jgi:hypothetical protein
LAPGAVRTHLRLVGTPAEAARVVPRHVTHGARAEILADPSQAARHNPPRIAPPNTYPHRELLAEKALGAQAAYAARLAAAAKATPNQHPNTTIRKDAKDTLVIKTAPEAALTFQKLVWMFQEKWGADEPYALAGSFMYRDGGLTNLDLNHPDELLGGAVIYSTENPEKYLRVSAAGFRPYEWHHNADDKGIVTGVEFGNWASAQHVESSILRMPDIDNDPALFWSIVNGRREVLDQIRAGKTLTELRDSGVLNGAYGIGGELEMFIHDPITGAPINTLNNGIGHDHEDSVPLIEFLENMPEIDEGIFVDPFEAAKGMATAFLEARRIVHAQDPDALVLRSGTPVSGSASDLRVNGHLTNPKGKYMAATDHRTKDSFGPHTETAQVLLDEVARREGYADFAAFKAAMPDTGARANGAAQLNGCWMHFTDPATGRLVADFYEAKDFSALIFGGLGSMFEMMSMTGPFLMGGRHGFAAKVDGQYIRSPRFHLRHGVDSSRPINVLFDDPAGHDPWRLLDVIIELTVMRNPEDAAELSRKGDRLDRGSQAHFDETTGNLHATPHSGRMKHTDQGVMRPTGITEECDSEASFVLQQVRKMSLMQVFMHLTQLALDDGKNVFKFIMDRTGLSLEDLQFDAYSLVADFEANGVTDSITRYREVMTQVIGILDDETLPLELKRSRQIALAAINQTFVDESTVTYNTLSNGRGTPAAASIALAKQGYTGVDSAWIIDDFGAQEAEFLANASAPAVAKYLMGITGFGYQIPTRANLVARRLQLSLERRQVAASGGIDADAGGQSDQDQQQQGSAG